MKFSGCLQGEKKRILFIIFRI